MRCDPHRRASRRCYRRWPMDSSLRESLEQAIQAPIEYVVSSKRDILATIDRVYGFRINSKVGAAFLALALDFRLLFCSLLTKKPS